MFLDSGSPLAHVAVASKGPSYLGNIDDILAAGVLQVGNGGSTRLQRSRKAEMHV